MSRNGLHRHYDRLSAEERFRLDVLATARGDTQESERLVRTCPRRTYTMNDRGFSGRWTGVMDITLRVYVPLGEHLTKVQMVDAFRTLIPCQQELSSNVAHDAYFAGHKGGSHHAWNAAGRMGHPSASTDGGPDGGTGEPDEDPAMDRDLKELGEMVERYGNILPEILDRLERECVGHALSIWGGYAAFCEECVGVDARKVAAVVLEPVMGRIEDMEARAQRLEVEADAEIAEEVRERLMEAWRVVEQRGV